MNTRIMKFLIRILLGLLAGSPFGTRAVAGERPVSGADRGSYRVLADGLAVDKDHVYWMDKPQSQVDTPTFKYLGMGYGKDKNHVYQFGSQGGRSDGKLKVITEADPKTFKLITGARPLPSVPTEDSEKPDAKDAKQNYRNGKVLSGK